MSESGRGSDGNLFGEGRSSFNSPPTEGNHASSPQEALHTEDFVKVEDDSVLQDSHMDNQPRHDPTSLTDSKTPLNQESYLQEGNYQIESDNLISEIPDLSSSQFDSKSNEKNLSDPIHSSYSTAETADLLDSTPQNKDLVEKEGKSDDPGSDFVDFLKTEVNSDNTFIKVQPEEFDQDSFSSGSNDKDTQIIDFLQGSLPVATLTSAGPLSQIRDPLSVEEICPPNNSPTSPSSFNEQISRSESSIQAEQDVSGQLNLLEDSSFQRNKDLTPLKEENSFSGEMGSPSEHNSMEEQTPLPKEEESTYKASAFLSNDSLGQVDQNPVKEALILDEMEIPPREDTPPLIPSMATSTQQRDIIPSNIREEEDFPGQKLSTSGISSLIEKKTKVDTKMKEESSVVMSVRRTFAVLNPVMNLIYWRDLKKSGVVFGSIMLVLLSLAYLSLISVVAYTSLAILTGTITFRIYKNIMQAIQKSQYGHPFKEYLELDTNLSSDKAHELTDVVVTQLNCAVGELKRLFLVDDLIDSVKFGFLLSCLTYVGAWFNGLTLIILMVVALFTLPKVYEQNKTQIDQYLGLVRTQVNDVMTKVKAAIPIGNKEKAQ